MIPLENEINIEVKQLDNGYGFEATAPDFPGWTCTSITKDGAEDRLRQSIFEYLVQQDFEDMVA